MPAARAERYPWLMWSLPALLFLIAFVHRVAPGVMAKDLMQAFDATAATIGLLSATYFYAYAGLMVPGGVLIDAWGVRVVVAVGGAVMGVGTLAMAFASGQPLLFAGRFAVGLGGTVTFIGALKVAALWFPASRFGFMSAVTATVGIVGALVGTVPLAALLGVVGWRGALVIMGAVTLAGALACALVLRDSPRRSHRVGSHSHRDHPEGREAPAPGGDARGPGLGAVLGGMYQVLRNPHTWPPFFAFFFLYSAMGNLQIWIVPCLKDVHGLGLTEAAFYATAGSTALLVSGPLTGWLSDRVLGRRKAPYLALNALLFVLWMVLVLMLGRLPLWGVYALLFAMGAANGQFVLTWPIAREVNPPRVAGVAVAVVNFGGFLGAALTQGPVGSVLDARWAGALVAGARVYPVDAYRAAFGVCAGLMLLSTVASLLMRETRGRNIHHEIG